MSEQDTVNVDDNIIDLAELWEQCPDADVLAFWVGLSTNNDKGIVLDNTACLWLKTMVMCSESHTQQNSWLLR